MRSQKNLKKILEEAFSIEHHAKEMRNGNLDIKIDTDHFTFLKDLAEDINQINSTFNTYIDEITHILSHLSAGNMTVSFSKDVHYIGDFLPIKDALYKIRSSMNSSFEEIHKLSKEMDAMSNQVENSSSFLATNTTEQAALISDLTSTIYDITDKTVNNATNAQTAAKTVEAITKETEIGRSYMKELLSSVDKVKSSIDNISNIIELIKGIAEQTRLLALNASIEAARAGENGQGFSVVASEINKLAQKSSEAVKETTQLINNSITAADESAKITKKTVESFQNIQDSIEGVAGLCKEIAELSNIQAESLQETSAIITNISEAVQNNAAYAQENSAGAMNLSNISDNLEKVLQRFRIIGQENLLVTDKNKEEEFKRELISKLVTKLFNATTTQSIDWILETEIQYHSDVECLYVINENGKQLSHTIMNPKIIVDQDDNFKPALPGQDYSSKKYFRQAIKNKQEFYTSSAYISKATGNLCNTVSYAYQAADNECYVICIDLLCKF
ncbi:MAG: hypothetical protein GX895_03760 [Clostridiales bacterium]|uniref:methyl-accepting chemotaxis protein n=1 Tax=Clostridium sp. N3C TaxID=1776758 RepID=UPI00092DEC5C|nr:methyl-accepting chemotaxis protein [Clostridium sp. N3C]NLZ47895.1 hypothetical protein [Clostridiales bacterium]SCN25043.1 Ribose and galactose chemoreceptor protein [Clostridium sp. N3C]